MPTLSFDSGNKVGSNVSVTEVGPDLYRIDEITSLLFDLEDDSEEALSKYPIYRDVIYAVPASTGNLRLVRIHQRGGYIQHTHILGTRYANQETFRQLCAIVDKHQGDCVLELGGVFSYAVPKPEHEAFSKALDRFFGEA